MLLLLPVVMCSCASTTVNDRHGFLPGPGMTEDSQDTYRTNTKYNLMDSPDGRRDPNGRINVWGCTY